MLFWKNWEVQKMNDKMSLGQYIPGNTFIHRLDPRVKIFLTVFYMVALFYINNILMYIPVVIYLGLIIYIAKLKPIKILKSLKPLLFIIVFTSILNILVIPGKELFSIWKIKVTDEGLYMAFFMSLRIVLLVAGTSLLTLTTSTIRLTDGLESIFSPLKIIRFPAHEIAMMISIALRFIPTLFEEADKIRKAQMARGADFDSGNLFKKAQSMIPLLVPLFLNSFRRADELAVAMVSRCYRGSYGRTRLNPLKMQIMDYITVVSASIFFVTIIVSKKFI